MLYNSLKFFHIVSASGLIISFTLCFYYWYKPQKLTDPTMVCEFIQMQTGFFIVPLALLQLLTGFTLISLNHEHFFKLWIKGSTIGFIVLILSWLAFVYFLIAGQQTKKYYLFFRRIQAVMLFFCVIAGLMMIFFMANKI